MSLLGTLWHFIIRSWYADSTLMSLERQSKLGTKKAQVLWHKKLIDFGLTRMSALLPLLTFGPATGGQALAFPSGPRPSSRKILGVLREEPSGREATLYLMVLPLYLWADAKRFGDYSASTPFSGVKTRENIFILPFQLANKGQDWSGLVRCMLCSGAVRLRRRTAKSLSR